MGDPNPDCAFPYCVVGPVVWDEETISTWTDCYKVEIMTAVLESVRYRGIPCPKMEPLGPA